MPVALRLVDVDDPSDYAAPIDDESTDTDNRSAVSANGGIVAMSDAQGVVTWKVSVSHRPGDNYRAVASVESMDLSSWVAGKASDGKLAQVYRTGPLGNYLGVVPQRDAKTVESSLLTVWRHLHVERDHMSAPQATEVFGGVGSKGVVNEDDENPGGPIPDPSITVMQEKYRSAYVEVADDIDDDNARKTIEFEHNLSTVEANRRATGIRDVECGEAFWVNQIVGMYEGPIGLDGDDPDTEGRLFGVASQSVSIFTEAIRDMSDFDTKAVSRGTLIIRTVLHESLHTWGMWHGKLNPDLYSVAALNSNTNIYGTDAANGLAWIHIERIRSVLAPDAVNPDL